MEFVLDIFVAICLMSIVLSLGISFRKNGLGFYWEEFFRNIVWLIVLITTFLVVVILILTVTALFVGGLIEIVKYIGILALG